MHITQHTDYALRVLVYLGTNEDRLVTIQEIADRFAVSCNHLMKVISRLIRAAMLMACAARAGILVHGWRGGFPHPCCVPVLLPSVCS
ncbi:Rrf2 family transcriptional regulator [Accumulibacter sp.]|jgi:Rrf2 family nitric oxide-sensitive transcriptional repressor|uniref:Rrf2 family transcriptional regulator n=1 Tax=Accumulibacter sp. TaxID=2053492 RepID=UPI0035AFE2D1